MKVDRHGDDGVAIVVHDTVFGDMGNKLGMDREKSLPLGPVMDKMRSTCGDELKSTLLLF